jgi:hypothetical protein
MFTLMASPGTDPAQGWGRGRYHGDCHPLARHLAALHFAGHGG